MKPSEVFSVASSGFFGVDLGTTNSVVATFKNNNQIPVVLSSRSGQITPSVVTLLANGRVIIGKEARNLRGKEPTFYSFKKYMGTTHMFLDKYTAKDISRIFIENLMKEIYEINQEYEKTKDMVISVPAYFDTPQIQDTVSVFSELGYNVLFVQKEPVAAALVYQTLKKINKTISVFDLGGGTFDTVLIDSLTGFPKESVDFYRLLGVELPNIEDTLSIIDIAGDNFLGGDNIDEEVYRLLCHQYRIRPPRDHVLNVIEDVKLSKRTLCFEWKNTKYDVTFELVEKATDVIWKRAEFIMLSRHKTKKAKNPHIVLCGGSTKSQYIREKLQENYEVSYEIDPDLSVAIGNAMTARNIIEKQGLPFLSVMPKYIGVKLSGRLRPIIKKGQVFPCVEQTLARSAQKYVTSMDVNFYESEDLFSTPSHITTVTVDDIKDWDENGYSNLIISIRVLADQTLKVEVFQEETERILAHEIKFVARNVSQQTTNEGSLIYKRFFERYKVLNKEDIKFENLLEEFKNSNDDKRLASELAVYLAKMVGKK